MSTRAGDALHVQAHSGAVRSLHERGLTWVSFEPMPNLRAVSTLRSASFPTSVSYPEWCRVSVTNTPARTTATARTTSVSYESRRCQHRFGAPRRDDVARWRRHAAQLLGLAGYQSTALWTSRYPAAPHVTRSTVRNIDDSVLCRIPLGTGMLNLLRNYVNALFDDPAIAMPEMRQLVITQLCDLIAVTLGATRDAPPLPRVAAYVWHGYAP